MSKPFFSIVLPVYNCETYIARAIESVLEQTDRDWELIIGDDCSSDRTPRIISFYANQDARIRSFRNDCNLSARKTLDLAISLSQGEWIVHIDADDFFNSNYLETLRWYIHREENRECLISAWVTVVDESDKKILDVKLPKAETIKKMMKIENFLYHSATSFKKESWKKVGGYPDDMRIAEDAVMWAALFDHGLDLVMIPDFLVNYRIHSSNITTFNDAHVQRDHALSARTFRHKKEWKISLYLKQNMREMARREILGLFQFQNYVSLKNLQYLVLTFFPAQYVYYFMWDLRPRLRQKFRSLFRKKIRV